MNYIKYLQNAGTITYANESRMPGYGPGHWYGGLVSGINGSRYSVHPGVYNFYTNEDGSISWGNRTGHIVKGSDGKQYVDFEVDPTLTARPELKTYQRFEVGELAKRPVVQEPVKTQSQINTEVQQPENVENPSPASTVRSKQKITPQDSKPIVKQTVPQNLSQKEEVKISPYADFDLNKAKELFASRRPQYNFSRAIPPENSYSGNHTVYESFSFLPKENFPAIELDVIDPNVSTFDGTKTDLKNGFLSPFNNKKYSYGIGNHKNILTNLRIYDPKIGEWRNYNISPDSELYKQFKFSENDPGNWLNAETYYNIVKNINNPSYFGEQYKPYRKIDKSKQLSKAGYPLRVNPYSQIDPNSDFYKNAGTYAKPESQKSWTELIYPKLDKGFGKIIGYITPEKIKRTTSIPGGRDNSSKRESNTQGDEIILPVRGNGGNLNYLNYIK